MPQSADYERWSAGGPPFGLVASAACALAPVDERLVVAPAGHAAVVWDLRTGEKLAHLIDESADSVDEQQVTALRLCHGRRRLAVGYADGIVRLFARRGREGGGDVEYEEEGDGAAPPLVLHGHAAAVSALVYSHDDLTLASGGKDTVVILWDVVNECGLFRLNGHKAAVTALAFTQDDEHLLSSGKDCVVKMWSMRSQSCFYTLADHKTEIYDMALLRADSLLVCAGGAMELGVYSLVWLGRATEAEGDGAEAAPPASDTADQYADQANSTVRCRPLGALLRQSKGGARQLAVGHDGRLLACVGSGAALDLFAVHTAERARRRRGKKMAAALRSQSGAAADDADSVAAARRLVAADLSADFARLGVYKCTGRPAYVAFAPAAAAHRPQQRDTGAVAALALVTLASNEVEIVRMSAADGGGGLQCARLDSVTADSGHRGAVRCAAFSADGLAVLTAGRGGAKLWQCESQRCTYTCRLRGAAGTSVVAAVLLPGDGHALLGTADGRLLLVDLALGGDQAEENAVVCKREADDDGDDAEPPAECPVWALCITADKKGAVSGGADKAVHVWHFELATDSATGGRRLMLSRRRRSLRLGDDVLCVCAGADGRLIAAGLLDNTARLFFADTFKEHVSLYGHSLPVLSVDMSLDGRLVATCGGDKSVKLWGADFGDCHRTLLAHDNSVTCVRFVGDTHEVMSCGKDGRLRRWDGDKFNLIQTLKASSSSSNAAVWHVVLSADGRRACTVNADCGIRLWRNTGDMLVLRDQQEQEREREHERSVLRHDDVVVGESGAEAQIAGAKCTDTVRAAENVLDALELIRGERLALSQDRGHKTTHPVYVAYKCGDLCEYFAETLRRIKSSEVEKCLLMLPFGDALEAMSILTECVRLDYYVELCARAALFLLRVNHNQIQSAAAGVPVVDKMRRTLPAKIDELRSVAGVNLAALRAMRDEVDAEHGVRLFMEAGDTVQKRRKKQKEKSDAVHVLTMNL